MGCLVGLMVMGGIVTGAGGRERVVVERVVDGDTIWVRSGGKRVSIRLIGIDTPESKPNNKAIRDSKRNNRSIKDEIRDGIEATKTLQTLVKPGDWVDLEFDQQRLDRYQRVLAYVYTTKGEMVNARLIQDGVARPYPISPNTRYRVYFDQLVKP